MVKNADSPSELNLTLADEAREDSEAFIASNEEDLEESQPEDALAKSTETKGESTMITLDEAKQQIGEATLSVLAEKFNGKLSGVRPVDAKDTLF